MFEVAGVEGSAPLPQRQKSAVISARQAREWPTRSAADEVTRVGRQLLPGTRFDAPREINVSRGLLTARQALVLSERSESKDCRAHHFEISN